MHEPGLRILRIIALIAASTGGVTTAGAQSAKAPPHNDQPFILIVPYQPVLRSVVQAKAQQTTTFLAQELEDTAGLTVVVGGRSSSNKAPAILEDALAEEGRARKAEANKLIQDAIDRQKAAIALFEKNAAALVEARPYVQALHRLGRALMWAGADERARKVLDRAAHIAPSWNLDPRRYSRLYRRWFAEAVKRGLDAPRGALVVKSQVPGASIRLDGQDIETAPVRISEVVPGRHWITASIDGAPTFGAFVTVASGRNTMVTVRFPDTLGGTALGEVADTIARNRLSTAAVRKAAAIGRKAGAKFVVLGALAKDRAQSDINVHTFVVRVADKTIARLPAIDFDAGLLTAESDIIQVVQQIAKITGAYTSRTRAVDTIETNTAGFAASPIVTVDGSPKVATRSGARPRQTRRTRRVYRADENKSVRIKDEGE